MSLAFLRASQQTCKYCKATGHNRSNCILVRDMIQRNLDQIHNIIDRLEHNQVENRLLLHLRLMSLTDISLLTNHFEGMKAFIDLLVTNGHITQVQTNMRLKENRVNVLMWYFWRFSEQVEIKRKPSIQVKQLQMVTDLTEFECPVCVTCLPAKEKVETGCKHCICKDCLVGFLEHQINNLDFTKPRCVMCRTDIEELTISNTDYINDVSELLL